jgi:hypothetical protein
VPRVHDTVYFLFPLPAVPQDVEIVWPSALTSSGAGDASDANHPRTSNSGSDCGTPEHVQEAAVDRTVVPVPLNLDGVVEWSMNIWPSVVGVMVAVFGK